MRFTKNKLVALPGGSLALAVFAVLCWGFLMPADSSIDARGPRPDPAQQLDRFGGVRVKISEPSGFFRVVKAGTRWVFVTPEGNPFWMLGVFNVDPTDSRDDLGDSYSNRILRKYRDKFTWGEQTARRLKAWGFNTIGEYSTWYVLPTKSPYADWSNPEKMPFVLLIRPSSYGLVNRWNYAPGPFKDLIAGTDPAIYRGWRARGLPDVFDPNFDAYVEGWLKAIQPEILKSPWLVGITTDDVDDLVGFGPGPEVPAARLHPHIGWLALVGNYAQTANSQLGVRYQDTKVYAKYALRDFLRARYAGIATLNKAWGATYTTWDSDGGWPGGTGLLDESGRHPWVGQDDVRLSTAAPQVREDLDDFLAEYAKQYFAVTTKRIRERAPNHLVFGPATLNGWGGLTRKQILQAAGTYVDTLQANVASQQVLDLTAKYAGDIPIVTWEGMTANPDSSLWRYATHVDGVAAGKTQEERGEAYARYAISRLDAATPGGMHPIAGLKFWAFLDSWGEKLNWGLVSFLDNAYDGKEAIKAAGKDRWNFSTGGEERDYGDFLSRVRQTNSNIVQQVREEMESWARSKGGQTPVAAVRR